MNEQTQTEKQWAIVELFGHQRLAGQVSDGGFAGCHFVRIDIPEIVYPHKTIPACTKLIGQGAIYGITFISEPLAREAAKAIRHEPFIAYGVNTAELSRLEFIGQDEEETDEYTGAPY